MNVDAPSITVQPGQSATLEPENLPSCELVNKTNKVVSLIFAGVRQRGGCSQAKYRLQLDGKNVADMAATKRYHQDTDQQYRDRINQSVANGVFENSSRIIIADPDPETKSRHHSADRDGKLPRADVLVVEEEVGDDEPWRAVLNNSTVFFYPGGGQTEMMELYTLLEANDEIVEWYFAKDLK